MDRLTTAHETIVTDFMRDISWHGQRQQQKLNWHKALIISAVKFVFWHLGQIVFLLDGVVCIHGYDVLGSVLLCHDRRDQGGPLLREPAARDLHLSSDICCWHPFSEKNTLLKLGYLLSPECVVMVSVGTLADSRDGSVFETFAVISYLVNIIASVSAWIALAIGFFGHGTMFPSLAVGYLLSGLSPIGAIAMGLW